MKRFFLALVTGAALAFSAFASAQAADAYQYFKKAPAPAAFSWNGFYLEGNLGYAFGDVTFAAPAAFAVEPKGITGGIGIGYDAHYASGIVLGAVVDLNFTGVERVRGIAPGIGISADLDYFGTVRGRLGYSFGTWMVYGTGGYAWGHLASDITGVGLSADEFAHGWAYGVGAEFALSRNWTIGAEWLRLDFSRAAMNFGPGTINASAEIDLAKAVVRYRF